ncbi:hypothetical protein ACWEF6_05435 [Amycolatopsis sp. NPDC004772]
MEESDSVVISLDYAYIPSEFAINAISVQMSPWGTPLRTSFIGKSGGVDANLLIQEVPSSFFPMPARLPKNFVELLQLNKFDTDHRFFSGLPFLDSIGVGSDPPDFVAMIAGRQVGVECTLLNTPGRREVNALFMAVREAILAQPLDAFSALRGLMVTVQFHDESGQAVKPFRRNDYPSIERLLEALNNFSFSQAAPVPGSRGERLDLTNVVDE